MLPRFPDRPVDGRPGAWGRETLGATGAGAVVIGFCFLLLWHDPLLFWNDDYSLSILPVFADVARSWSEGQWPLLSPYSWVCGNLAGEFQYATFSVFVNAVVVLIWKLPLVFSQQAAALSIAHLFVMAAGCYLLARGRRIVPPLALMVALAGTLNGWMICWGATDWFGALAALAWLPWSWWALEIALAEKRPSTKWLLPAPFIYLLIAGGFPYTIAMLALLTLWLAARDWAAARNFGATWRMAVGWAMGVGLSAPAWLSLFAYVHGSQRAQGSHALHREWIVPPGALPGFILPSWTVRWPDFDANLNPHIGLELACGLAPAVILLAGLFSLRGKIWQALRWELALLFGLIVLCLLPSPSVFRFSFRWLALVHLVLGLTAAEVFQIWQSERNGGTRWRQNLGAWSLLFTAGTWAALRVAGAAGWAGATSVPAEAVAISACWAIAERLLRGGVRGNAWLPAAVSVAAFASAYLHVPTNMGVPKFNFGPDLSRPAPLDPNRLYLSFYPEPHIWYRAEETDGPCGLVVRPGSTSLFGGVHLVNGYSPIAPSGVSQLFGFETHGQIEPSEAEYLAGYESGPDGILARLGIDGLIVASDFPLSAPLSADWQLVHADKEGRVFHRAERIPAAHPLRLGGESGVARLTTIENSRHRVVVDVSTEGLGQPVVIGFSRPFFPGYHATLDGVNLPVSSWDELIPITTIPAGKRGTLTLTYRPDSVVFGGLISALSILAGGGAWLVLRAKAARHALMGELPSE